MITYEQIADWVLANRSGNAFLDYSKPEIVAELMDRVDYDLVWYHATNEHLEGVVTADEVYVDGKPVIYVRNAIAKHRRVVLDFLERYISTYRNIPLRYMHRGRERTINPARLLLTPH